MNTLFHFRLFVIINIAIINSGAKIMLFLEPAITYLKYFVIIFRYCFAYCIFMKKYLLLSNKVLNFVKDDN
jgi:hypothetical protein